MKRTLTLAVAITLLCIAASTVAGLQPGDVDARERAAVDRAPSGPMATAAVNRALERLAASLAGALADPAVRALLYERLKTPGDVLLRSLLAAELPDGSLFAERLAAGYYKAWTKEDAAAGLETAIEEVLSILEAMPNVDLSMPINLESWVPETQTPVVSFIEEGIQDEARTTVKLFDASGRSFLRGVEEVADFPFPVVALEYHEAEDTLSRPPQTLRPQLPLAAEAFPKVGPSCTTTTTYRSYPLISEAACFDAHEGGFNGPDGYMYFTSAGTEKTGNLPSSLGGRSGWGTFVWGSNFQGPKPVYIEILFGGRLQWEWTSDGWWEYSHQLYPARYAQQSVNSTNSFSVKQYTIKEDDEWPNGDDYVGKVEIDHRKCKSDVFDQGQSSGWSGLYSSPKVGDIKDVKYELYCSSSQSFTCSLICNSWGDKVICGGSGNCSGCQAGPDWIECNGVRFDCDDLVE